VTPVPLDLPLRPSEAAEVANLVFDIAERKPLTDEVRARVAARGAILRLESMTPWFRSLERDPVHPSSYYLAVDGAAREPLLLHMAVAAAPTSSIFYKPLLIGRMRRANGPEIVLNAVPFGPGESERVSQFAARIDTAFFPQPLGSRLTIPIETANPERDLPAAFDAFRAIVKRTGKNVAAVIAPEGADPRRHYHAVLWAAIRAGWREGYSAGVTIGSREEARESAMFSRFRVVTEADEAALEAAARLRDAVREARSASKIARSFDFELAFRTPVPPDRLAFCLEWLKGRGHAPQLIAAGFGESELEAVARRYQCVLSRASVSNAESIAETAEHLLG
jgi:hypothetical protein